MKAQDAQGEVLRRVADTSMTRDDVAGAYAMALQASGFVQWPVLNRAIINRWSESALHYIKDEAWKLAEHNTGQSQDTRGE